ncbi:MAG TPA: hypothetical protein PLB89_04820 [Flavobacteriales bacterium]|nr:hypothetical protein [Flavobacteriales bacterium]
MAEPFVVAELLVRKHIRKYLARKLNPATAATSPWSFELSRHIAELCAFRVEAIPPPADDLKDIRPRLQLTLAGPDLRNMDPVTHNKVLEMVEELYRREFHSTVDQLHLTLGVTLVDAIHMFRAEYHITEEDYPLTSSNKCYYRHFWRTYPHLAKARKRGPPRKPLVALTPAYRVRMMREKGLEHPDTDPAQEGSADD